ncbi:hypothetical protein ACQPZQ_42940 [Pseudonocardia sp. CA-142604]|uniref:hypothetical protein n=1 Tax=Pseudonocardia sp. CA-142604 TaxID=3240024 RepID=UPI003D8D497B
MSTSIVLLLVGVGCGAGFAALAVYGQVSGGTRLRNVGWAVPAGILVVGSLLGVGAYWLDSSIARTTLFEVDADGSTGVAVGAPAPVREFDIHVEHPGVEHTLFVNPINDDSGTDPSASVELHVRLTDPAGGVLADQPLLLELECRPAGCGWQDWTTPFTPTTAAPHRLSVTVRTVDVPAVHLLVTDPEKTDGERAPGY